MNGLESIFKKKIPKLYKSYKNIKFNLLRKLYHIIYYIIKIALRNYDCAN